jgi:hypothetical protein
VLVLSGTDENCVRICRIEVSVARNRWISGSPKRIAAAVPASFDVCQHVSMFRFGNYYYHRDNPSIKTL